MKSALIIAGILILVAGAIFALSSSKPKAEPLESPTPTPQAAEEVEVDTKASFAIFTNGTLRIFTDSRYHNLSPDVYIESPNPNIVHVKKAGITCDDFFKTLPMKLEDDCLTTGTGQTFCTNETRALKFYINGQLDAATLNRVINSGDKLLVSYGPLNDPAIEYQLEQIPLAE